MHTNTLEQNTKKLTIDVKLKFKKSEIAAGGVTAFFHFTNPYTLTGSKGDVIPLLKEKEESNKMFVERVKQFINGSLAQRIKDSIQNTINANNKKEQRADDLTQIRHLWGTDTEFTVEINIKE